MARSWARPGSQSGAGGAGVYRIDADNSNGHTQVGGAFYSAARATSSYASGCGPWLLGQQNDVSVRFFYAMPCSMVNDEAYNLGSAMRMTSAGPAPRETARPSTFCALKKGAPGAPRGNAEGFGA